MPTDHDFCGEYLKEVMADVYRFYSPRQVAKTRTTGGGSKGPRKFYGPEGELFEDPKACCQKKVTATGWLQLMRQKRLIPPVRKVRRMAEPYIQTKSNRGKPHSCEANKCIMPVRDLVVGQKYYQWDLYESGSHYQHVDCGKPKRSQLVDGKLKGAFSALEDAEESLAKASDKEAIVQTLRDCASALEGVKGEYEDALEAMVSKEGAIAESMNEKIENLDSATSALEGKADELEGDEEMELDDLRSSAEEELESVEL